MQAQAEACGYTSFGSLKACGKGSSPKPLAPFPQNYGPLANISLSFSIGTLTVIAFLPPFPVTSTPPLSLDWLNSAFTVLPIQMFNRVSRPPREFHLNAAASGLNIDRFPYI